MSVDTAQRRKQVLDDFIKKTRKMAEIFDPNGCAICVFVGETQTPSFKCDRCPGGIKFYCAKHVKRIAEHNKSNKNYHEVESIFPSSNLRSRKQFDDIIDKNIDDVQLLSDCMVEELNIQKTKMIKSVQDRAKEMREEFARQMIIQEGTVKAQLERRMKERTMELESEQDIFETRKEVVDDFQKREATKRNELEFVIAAREAQNCIRTHDFKFSPVLNLHRPAEGVAFTAFGATPAPFSLVKVDAINAYWRELSAQKILYIDSPNEQLPKWSFRDAPLITLEHPDRQELGLPMIQAISLRARVLLEAGFIRPYEKMEQILDLVESSRENRKTATVIYKNEVTGDLHRMALRYLTKSFNETRPPLALQFRYETNDPEIRSKEVFTRLKKHFKIDYIPYDEQRNCRGIILNSFMIYPRDERELTSIRNCLRKNPRIWADFDIPKVEVWSKSTLILTDLDDPKNSPVVVTHKLLESGRLMNCHRDIEVSKDKPAMIVECWFDEKHPTGRPDNYDPYMKQMKEVSTLYDLKERITTTFNSKKKLKIFLEKPVDYHRMPWVWLCSAKIKGKSIGEEIEGLWIKRTYGYPVSPCDDECGESTSLDTQSY